MKPKSKPSVPALDAPPAPATTIAPAQSSEPEVLSLDDDPAPLPPTHAEPTSGDPFAFSAPHTPLPKGGSKGKQNAINDEKPKRNSSHLEVATEEPPDNKRGGYVRPGERQSRRPLLLSALLGAVVGAAVIGGVILVLKNGHAPEQAQSTEKTEKKEDSPAPPPPEKPANAKIDRAAASRKAAPTYPKAEPSARAAAMSGAMLALPRGGRPIQLRAANAKPESTQNPSGAPISLDVPFDRVKWFIAPENRVAQDAVVVWQANAAGGQGERFAVDTYSGTTGMRVGRFEFDGDGKGLKCDVSPDGKLFVAATADGKITVWNLADKTTPLSGFDPYADKPDHQKAGLAAVFFASNSTDLVTVTSAGAIHLFEIATRKPLAELVLPKGSPGHVALGKTVAADAGRASVVVAVGGVIYQVATNIGLPIAWKLELGGEMGRAFGIAAVGVPGRVAFAFETDVDKTKEKVVLFCRPNEKPIVQRWPDAAGEPTGIHWAGGNMAIIATTRGALWVDTEGKSFTPVAFAEVPNGKGRHATTETSHWYLLPSSGDAAKSLLLELTLPPANLIDFRNAADAKQPLHTLRLDEKGLWK